MVPLLMGHRPHAQDNALRGAWVRRSNASRAEDKKDDSCLPGTKIQKLCWRPALSEDLCWLILNFAGHLKQDDGTIIGIANNHNQLESLKSGILGSKEHPWIGMYTSSGVHDEQLPAEEFMALRHVEVAARLEYMAEARGRPRPGQQHPDAEDEHSEVGAGGDRQDSDVDFEGEDALPGGEDARLEENEQDLQRDFRSQYPVQDEDELREVVHRQEDAKKHMNSKQATAKKDLLQTFMAGHETSYDAASKAHAPRLCSPVLLVSNPQERKEASRRQKELLEARKPQKQPWAQHSLHQGAGPMALALEPRSRPLDEAELPPSPLDFAIQLIATSGVWRSKEQYLATLFMLQPIQELWEKAREQGLQKRLRSVEVYASLAADVQSRPVFLHGPGGSGKTFCVTEVVMKVVQKFFGEQAVQAIAAANSAARLLRGKTMHAAGKMTRQQSLKSKKLKPTKKAKDALTLEWEAGLLLLGDEIGTAAPPLLAGVSRRASYGRRDLYNLDMLRVMEQPFGNMLLQVMMGDFLQLNPVKSHTLLQALVPDTTRVPGTPRKTTDEDRDGYKIFRHMCQNVILFTGTHRFKDESLPKLLEIMRTRGGLELPSGLRKKIQERIVDDDGDWRLSPDFEQEGQKGFFAYGARAAIQWEQVARLQQLHIVASARVSSGARAAANDDRGKPDLKKISCVDAPGAPVASGTHQAPKQGQLVYYFQAVDRFAHARSRAVYMEALKSVNMFAP